MLSLAPEVTELEAAGAISPATAGRLRTFEQREIFSIQPELRVLAWGGVMLIVAGVGGVIAKNLDKIGPVALAAAIGLAAAACYAYCVWRKRGGARHFVDEFVLLLGALLLSADLAYIESQFHLLDNGWPRHFLILAIIHGVTAYWFDSRTLLSLSIAALAAWLGIEQRLETFFASTTATSLRAFTCAAVVLAWRLADQRLRPARSFERVFDHAVANLALLGALILTFRDDTRILGTLLTVVIAAVVVVYGFRQKSEPFVIYAFVYAVIAVNVVVVDALGQNRTATLLFLIVSGILSIVGLFMLHGRFRREGA